MLINRAFTQRTSSVSRNLRKSIGSRRAGAAFVGHYGGTSPKAGRRVCTHKIHEFTERRFFDIGAFEPGSRLGVLNRRQPRMILIPFSYTLLETICRSSRRRCCLLAFSPGTSDRNRNQFTSGSRLSGLVIMKSGRSPIVVMTSTTRFLLQKSTGRGKEEGKELLVVPQTPEKVNDRVSRLNDLLFLGLFFKRRRFVVRDVSARITLVTPREGF